jgi:toxin-antitoxin system PIN domain toxin
MIGLLDVNVLIALAWPNHLHHATALEWFDENREFGWATCPLTQSGFVRVSSNQKVLPDARSPKEAFKLLSRLTALEHHVFWHDDTSLANSTLIAPHRLQGYRQVTDAHLLAIALRHGGRLVTMDRAIRGLAPDGFVADLVVTLVA